MRGKWTIAVVTWMAVGGGVRPGEAQTYGLSVAVDEVSLTFHAADAKGQPLHDVKVEELRLLDNGRPPGKILAFEAMRDSPIRAGLLLDTSASMRERVAGNRAIAREYVERVLRPGTDQAFVMDFGRVSTVLQGWTGDQAALRAGIEGVRTGGLNRVPGTAIFDNVYRACRVQFGEAPGGASGNFVLLFSDGDDNASAMPIKEAVDMCQRTHTAVYAFRAVASDFHSSGARTLEELAAETGGRVFREDESEAEIAEDLRTIEGDMRDQYRLVYRPAEMKQDGAFHRIVLTGVDRVERITVRSGYYAPGGGVKKADVEILGAPK